MDNSILHSIKKLLGGAATSGVFDTDILYWINSAFATLQQLGVGPEGGFSISDDTSTWTDYREQDEYSEMIKTYIYITVRLGFDPPASSSILQSMERSQKEQEWRLNVAFDKTGGDNS